MITALTNTAILGKQDIYVGITGCLCTKGQSAREASITTYAGLIGLQLCD